MDSIPWDDLDFVQDLASRGKFEFTTRDREQLSYGRIDSDYESFLIHALEYVASKQCVKADNDDDENVASKQYVKEDNDDDERVASKQYVKEDNDDDAQYHMFLKNLKEDGKSYVAEVAIDNNATVFIKYEAEDPSDEHDSKEKMETNVGSCQKPPKGNHLFEVEWEPDYKRFCEGWDFEIASNSEVFMTNNPSDFNRGNKNPFATSRLFDSFIEEDELQLASSGFREKLMCKLREPYNQKEYEKLWQIINEQKRKDGRHRDLRGGAALKSYLIDECNQSYLERYSDLKRKIDAVKFDQCKVLSLLRGFFFWLENLVHQDAFQPWLDPSCLEVMPRNC